MGNLREERNARLAQYNTRDKASPPGGEIPVPVVAKLAPSSPWVTETVKTSWGVEVVVKAIHASR